jgi:predicted nucleic-acid-binding Zn-ribbon protein
MAKKAFERTCKNCGHVWQVDRSLAKGRMSHTLAGDSVALLAMQQADTCSKCGSARRYTERKIPA